ncbi:MAG: hypothetical protein ABEJ92_03295 [Halobacteriales archaeon]
MAGLDAIREAIEDAENLAGRGIVAYNAWMGAASAIALAKDRTSFLPDSFLRSLLARCLREAEESARNVDWSEHDEIEQQRQDIYTSPKFRSAISDLLGRSPVVEIRENQAYVGTITADSNSEELLEEWLDAKGFRQNAIAYLKYRTRDGEREYEQGSWTYRKDTRADKQLHVRLFDGDRASSVDIYAHREPSIIKGEEHFGRPNYREGVCQVKELLSDWAVSDEQIEFNRLDELPNGISPKNHDCDSIESLE